MNPILSLQEALKLKEQYPTPFYIYDEKGIIKNLRELLAAFSWNKGFKEYFAVKATPNPAIIKILHKEGCGVDCSSYTELMLAEALGLSGADIFFSSNNTPADEYKYAMKLGARINLDDITHIRFLDNVSGLPQEVCCRYNPGDDFKINNEIMDNPAEAKYGFTYRQLVEGLSELKKRGTKKLGIHAFLASNCLDNDYYPALAEMLFTVAARLKLDQGIELSFVNLSGGIGIPYLPEQKCVDIHYIGEKVREAFTRVLVPAGLENLHIYAEFGRYITGPFGQLITTAIHEKNIYKKYIGVDACAVDLLRPAMYKAYHHISVLGKEELVSDRVYDIVGSLCENNDKFAINRYLPPIDIGDILVIHDAGAHGHAMGYNYNGKLRCAEILKRADGSYELIRRAETPRDYFSTLDIYEMFQNQTDVN
ncbi:MAG: diaminopimelate decarboxylase [Clostridiales bacterium]|nr:diaminopimelate decarboxylase [Clostridiales bacterium]